jgi:hypothetical protein
MKGGEKSGLQLIKDRCLDRSCIDTYRYFMIQALIRIDTRNRGLSPSLFRASIQCQIKFQMRPSSATGRPFRHRGPIQAQGARCSSRDTVSGFQVSRYADNRYSLEEIISGHHIRPILIPRPTPY